MKKDKKRNILIIVLLGLSFLMIAFIVWWQFFRGQISNINSNISTTNSNTNTQIVTINTSNNMNFNLNVNVKEEEYELSIQRLANIFVERFGSYTSESEFQNTLDLKVYMTDKLKKWADNYVNSQKNSQPTEEYYVIITKVLSTKILFQSDLDAKVKLFTKRTESGDNFTEDNIFNQPIELELKYNNSRWLVNKITWGDK